MNQEGESLYLDWAATAPLCSEAYEAMKPYFVPGKDNFPYGANPNSLHSYGRAAFAALEEARLSLARDLGASRPDEIVFTSGATEANNAALHGIISASRKRAVQEGKQNFVPHLITSEIEHEAVLAPARTLKAAGCEFSLLKPDRRGFIDPKELEALIKPETVLVSIQMANNEIGSIQSIAQLAAIAHKGGALFHTDAVQALGKVPLDLKKLGVDAASFSAHKIGGPKGIGALYLKKGLAFEPFLIGGGQEFGKRSGTQNVAGAVGFAAAVKAACLRGEQERVRLGQMRDGLYEALGAFDEVTASVEVQKGASDFLPHIVNVYVRGIESETMILRLDMRGIEVSAGSACSSQSLTSSHVLNAIGLSPDQALGSLRVSFGLYTEQNDIERFIDAFSECIRL